MKIAYNPQTEAALTVAPSNNDITFDLSGLAIYAKGVKFDGKAYSIFKKQTSATAEGYSGLVPTPSYNNGSTNRFLREDGTWEVPESVGFTVVSSTAAGLAPKIGTEAASTISVQSDEWVLTSTKGATPTWRKFPTNAFLNYYRPIQVNGTTLLGNNNTALNIVAGTNINLTTDAGKVTINNTITKLSDLTDDILSGKYLPLTGGTLTGSIYWESGTGQQSKFPGHIYRNLYDSKGNVYDYYGLSDSITTFANLRVYEKDNSYKALRFGGDGTFTWNEYKVWHAGNDGKDSGLDADMLDGKQGNYYAYYSGAINADDENSYQYIGYGTTDKGWINNGSVILAGTSRYKMLLQGITNDKLAYNYIYNGTKGDWKYIAFTDSDITGNAATATNADKLDGYDANAFYNLYGGEEIIATEENPVDLNDYKTPGTYYSSQYVNGQYINNLPFQTAFVLQVLADNGSPQYYIKQILNITQTDKQYTRRWQKEPGEWTNWVLTSTNLETYNAPTATKLAVPVQMWGNDFDGINDIQNDLYLYKGTSTNSDSAILRFNGTYGNSVQGPSIRSIYTGAYGRKRFSIFQHDAADYTTENEVFSILPNGNVGIGTITPTTKLEISGNVKADNFLGNIDWNYIINRPTSFTPATHYHDQLSGWTDTRDTTTTPNDYNNSGAPNRSGIFKIQGIKTPTGSELNRTLLGTSGYATIIGWRGWQEKTGGYAWEIASTDNNRLYVRSGSDTTWNNGWQALAYTNDNFTSNQINLLTGYTKATAASDLTTTDTLNVALGKLEYKADTAYDWIISVTTEDTDKYINKWQEILDFLNKVDNTEGADITDEFVTRKTDQTITGIKTFKQNENELTIHKGNIITDVHTWGGWARSFTFKNTSGDTTTSASFGVYGQGSGPEGTWPNHIKYLYLAHNDQDYTTATFKVYGDKATILDNEVYHKGNLKNLSDLNDDLLNGKYLPLSGGTLTGNLIVQKKVIDITSTNAKLRLVSSTNNNANYIESGDLNFTNNAPLKLTGYNTFLGSDLDLYFTNIYCRAERYLNIDAGNYSSYLPFLNSTSTRANKTSVIYAPATVGTKNQVLVSSGSGAPTWQNQSSIIAGGLNSTVIFRSDAGSFNYVKFASINLTSRYSGAYSVLKLTRSFSTQFNKGYSCDLYVHCYQQNPLGNSPIYTIQTNNDDSIFKIIGIVNYSETLSTLDLYVYGYGVSYCTISVITIVGNNIINIGSNLDALPSGTIVIPSKVGHVKTANNGIFYIAGTGSTAGVWLGSHTGITEYYEGLTIAYKIPIAGAATTTLNINNLGAKTCIYNNSNLTTHYNKDTIVILVYDGTQFRVSDYNSDIYVRQYLTTSDNIEYPLLFRYNTTAPSSNYVTQHIRYNNNITVNPSVGSITASIIGTNTLMIKNTTSSPCISFSREGNNYITAPTTNGVISFSLGDNTTLAAQASLHIARYYLFPGTTNTISFGSDTSRWSNVYSVSGDFSGDVILRNSGNYTQSPHLKFLRNSAGDDAIDWEIYAHNGSLFFNNDTNGTISTTFQLYASQATFNCNVQSSGFIKNGSSNDYVLLGGGGHKALSDFLLKSELANQELSNNLTTITKELTVTQDWMDTGITGTDIPASGTYIIQMFVRNTEDDLWNCYWSGVMSWYRGEINDAESDEILLHRSGHAYENTLYLRTYGTYRDKGGILKLQIAANKTLTTAATYTFKFKRII